MRLLRAAGFWAAVIGADAAILAASLRGVASETVRPYSVLGWAGPIAGAGVAIAAVVAASAAGRRSGAGPARVVAATAAAAAALAATGWLLTFVGALAGGAVLTAIGSWNEGSGFAMFLPVAFVAWHVALAATPAGAALAVGPRPLNPRTLGAGQRLAAMAGVVTLALATLSPPVGPSPGVASGVAAILGLTSGVVAISAAAATGWFQAQGPHPEVDLG